jgi:hypothetical protein
MISSGDVMSTSTDLSGTSLSPLVSSAQMVCFRVCVCVCVCVCVYVTV